MNKKLDSGLSAVAYNNHPQSAPDTEFTDGVSETLCNNGHTNLENFVWTH